MHVGEAVKSLVPPTEWLKVNSQIVNLVQKWADRDDLMVAIGPGRGGATAFFDPKMCQIEINTDIAFGEKVDPSLIGDLNLRQVQFEYPKGTGAILHEAAHARYTTYDLKTAYDALGDKAYDALMMLEESRIENLILDEYPANRAFLRSCILEIVLKEESEEEVMALSGTRRAARLAQLALARVDTKVLKKKDVKTYRAIIEKILGADLLIKLRNIWTEFQNIKNPDRQLNRMYTLAREWAKLIDEAAKDDDAREEELQKMMQAIMEALGSQVGSTEIDAQGDVYQQQTQEKWEEQQKEKEKRDQEKAENENAANQVFSKSVQVPKDSKTTGGNGQDLRYQNSYSRESYSREPTGEERSAAVTVSHALEKAKYHDRIRIESNSVIPPGRLRTRAAVQNAAYRSMNMRNQAEPFRRVQRKHQIDPNLTVGVMFDISGSMGGAMEPMGVTAWVMSEAVKKIQGTFAMVSYGYDVNPIVKKGQHQEKVSIYSAPDGSEAFSLGFKALDGALELLNGTGARLLVVVSDGNYKGSEVEGAKKWLKRCEQEGVAVLWLGYGHSSGAEAICHGTNANLVIPASTAAEVAQQVGKAATDVLNKTGSSKV